MQFFFAGFTTLAVQVAEIWRWFMSSIKVKAGRSFRSFAQRKHRRHWWWSWAHNVLLILYFSKPSAFNRQDRGSNYYTQGQSQPRPPHRIIQSSLDPPHCARLHALYSSAPQQVCCCLFLNSCYSGATLCVQNTKHPASLSLVPSLTVGDWSHHRLASIHTTVDTSDECQPKSPLLVLLPHSLGTHPCRCKHTISLLSLPLCLALCLSSAFRHHSQVLYSSTSSCIEKQWDPW